MQALVYLEANKLEWQSIPEPTITNDSDALVAPLAVAACDLDRNIVRGSVPFPGPFVLGHEFCGRVEQVGAAVTSLAAGDLVLASFQPSCGTCAPCHSQHSSVCRTVQPTSMYGIGSAGGDWSGALAEQIRVPWADNNLRVLPDLVTPALVASGSDNLADGLRAVDAGLAARPGASVLVAGSGSIALYALLCAKHLGAEQITLASPDKFCLQVADAMGVACLEVSSWPKKFRSHEITVDCTGVADGLNCVIRSTAPYGVCTSCSIYFGQSPSVPMFEMNMKGIEFHTGRVNSAASMDRVLKLVSEGLDPLLIQPVLHPFEEAKDVLLQDQFSEKLIFTRGN